MLTLPNLDVPQPSGLCLHVNIRDEQGVIVAQDIFDHRDIIGANVDLTHLFSILDAKSYELEFILKCCDPQAALCIYDNSNYYTKRVWIEVSGEFSFSTSITQGGGFSPCPLINVPVSSTPLGTIYHSTVQGCGIFFSFFNIYNQLNRDLAIRVFEIENCDIDESEIPVGHFTETLPHEGFFIFQLPPLLAVDDCRCYRLEFEYETCGSIKMESYYYQVEETVDLKIGDLQDTICAGDCIELSINDSRIPGLFGWDLPGSDIGISSDSFVVVCYPEAGEYDVEFWLETCFGGQEELWEQAIVVLDKPEVEIEGVIHHQIVEGDTLRLSTCHEGDQILPVRWETDAVLDCYDCQEPLFLGMESGFVKAIIAPGTSCKDSCLYYVEVIPRVSALFEMDRQSVCEGECVMVENKSRHYEDPVEYLYQGEWRQLPPEATQIEVCPEATGLHELTFVVRNSHTVDSMSVDFSVVPVPFHISVQTHFEVEYGDQIWLEPGLEAFEYEWSIDLPGHLDLLCSDCPVAEVVAYQSSGISLHGFNEHCSDYLDYFIEVFRQEAQIYIPNAFSPNGDGINDDFGPEGLYFTTVSLKVYNRYGGLLYEGRGADSRWDGSFKGRKVNPGAYLYTLEYENLYGERDIKSGEVIILE